MPVIVHVRVSFRVLELCVFLLWCRMRMHECECVKRGVCLFLWLYFSTSMSMCVNLRMSVRVYECGSQRERNHEV